MREPKDLGLTPEAQGLVADENEVEKRRIIIRPEDVPCHLSELRETDDLKISKQIRVRQTEG